MVSRLRWSRGWSSLSSVEWLLWLVTGWTQWWWVVWDEVEVGRVCLVLSGCCDWWQDERSDGESFEMKSRLVESVLAPTLLHKQAKHAAQSSVYNTCVFFHSVTVTSSLTTRLTAEAGKDCLTTAPCGPAAIHPPPYPFTSLPSTLSFSTIFSLSYLRHVFLLFHSFPFYQNTPTQFPGWRRLNLAVVVLCCFCVISIFSLT